MEIKDLPPKLQALAISTIQEHDSAPCYTEKQIYETEVDWFALFYNPKEGEKYWNEINLGIGIEEKEAALWKEQ